MRPSCGKLVQKSVYNHVEKYVQKLCKENVQKFKMWISEIDFIHSVLIIHKSGKVLHHLINKLRTFKQAVFNLLRVSFPRFPHRTIITTTKYI